MGFDRKRAGKGRDKRDGFGDESYDGYRAPSPYQSDFGGGRSGGGFGGGFFSVGSLTAAMALDHGDRSGLALGAWGAVQATAAGGATSTTDALLAPGGAYVPSARALIAALPRRASPSRTRHPAHP